MPVSPARLAAFRILLLVEQRSAYASELLHSEHLNSLSPADHGLCTELVMGCLRWQASLDRLLAEVSSQKPTKFDPEVLVALRLGAYQLRFLSRIPPSAAVNESVELVKRARKKSAAPLANAVLRKLARQAASGGVSAELLSIASATAAFTAEEVRSPASAVVAPAGSAQALVAAWSHPEWLVTRWVEQYGAESARRICEFDQHTPGTALRFPRNPESAEALARELQAEGVELAPGNLLRSARLVRAGDITHTRAYLKGRVAIQDEASQLVAALVGTGLRILDCCAAPGGKTAAMAEANPQATILAVELHPRRAELLRERLQRSPGAGRIEVIAADITRLHPDQREPGASGESRLPVGRQFDRILADVPCSGTGTLARNPEIKWKLRPADLPELHPRQSAIISAALGRLAPGGILIYSTCSLEPEENASVVEEALRQNPSARLIDCALRLRELQDEGELTWPDVDKLRRGPYLQTLPGVQPCDGFFAAMISL